MTKVGSCKGAPKDAPTVIIVKQWHLPPKTVTKGFKERYPHEKNQSAIYTALADKVKSQKLDLVVAEGCEGEINEDFSTEFNGWSMIDLKKIAQTKVFQRTLAPVPMKLEARFGDKLKTICGDNEKQIQEGLLRLSNLRGWAGFYARLSEGGDAEKLKPYAESAAALLKEDTETPPEKLLPLIQKRLAEDLDLFTKSLTERNNSFVKALQGNTFKTAAVVIGGLHARDLANKVEAAGFNCDIMEPSGYSAEDERLVEEFKRAAGLGAAKN